MDRSRRLVILSALAGGTVRLRPAVAQAGGEKGFPYGDLKEITLQGSLVDLREQLARKYGAKVGTGEPQWALALPEGQLYTFLQTPSLRPLLAAATDGRLMEGRAVEVRARQFPRSTLLEVLSFREIPATALKRRFYCNVCAIHTEDWGPCVCCGQEMKVVTE